MIANDRKEFTTRAHYKSFMNLGQLFVPIFFAVPLLFRMLVFE